MFADSEDSEALVNILQAANKHPNSKVAKLVHCIQKEASQKSIVLLLIELAENSEYVIDFGISLKYYLNLFERLGMGQEIMLNETGLLLLNSSKVYARRVDYVQELVEHQIITLSKNESETTENKIKQQSKTVAEKIKRGRKRLLDIKDDPYEEGIVPKKFRKVASEKRLANVPTQDKSKMCKYRIIEQYLHQKVWMDSIILDLENEEDNDSKRNYKFFTYQVEHRYNTLITDINFELFFLVKDYIEEEEDRLLQEGVDISKADLFTWPPLSEEFIQKYLNLENKVLALNAESSRPCKRLKIDIGIDDFYHIPKANQENESCLEKSTVQNVNLISDSILECNNNSECLNTSQNEHNEELIWPTGSGFEDNTQNISDSASKNVESSMNESASTETIDNTTIEELETSGETNNSIKNVALEEVQNLNSTEKSVLESSKESFTMNETINCSNQNETSDSACIDGNQNSLDKDCIVVNSIAESNLPESLQQNDTGLGESINEKNMSSENANVTESSAANSTESIEVVKDHSTGAQEDTTNEIIKPIKAVEENDQIDLNKIRVRLPHLDNEGVYFSDLNEHDQLLLSPAVIATDVFPCITKKNITIIIDDEIKTLLNIRDDEPETFQIPVEQKPTSPKISLNIFKINEKLLKRRVLFKLGQDMDAFLRARTMKRAYGEDKDEARQYKTIQLFPPNKDNSDCDSDLGSSYMSDDDQEEDFLGFTEEEQKCNGAHRLSRDSGVSVDTPLTSMYGLEAIEEDFQNAAERLLLQQQSQKEANNESVKENLKGANESEESERMEDASANIIGNSNETNQADESGNSNSITEVNLTNASNEKEAADSANTIDDNPSNKSTSLMDTESELNIDANALPDMDLKIQKWHEHLRPILAKSRERHHFDVFEIGTEIMDKFQNTNSDTISSKVVTFEDVMSNKDKTSVSRYLLSSLLLANQNNIKIIVNNKNPDAPSEWNDIHFELLSTKRHSVAIEDNIGMTSHLQQNASNRVEKSQISTTNNAGTTSSAIKSVKSTALENNASSVNLNVIRPLKEIGRLPCVSDDFDSGIFSAEDCAS